MQSKIGWARLRSDERKVRKVNINRDEMQIHKKTKFHKCDDKNTQKEKSKLSATILKIELCESNSWRM